MNEQYSEVYSILVDINKLSREQYNQLVSLYGDNVVDSVIKDLIEENVDNFNKFEIYFTLKNDALESNTILNGFKIYMMDVNRIPCLDMEKNSILMKKIYTIIQKLDEIFAMFNCDDLIIDYRKTPWIVDKVEYCLSVCDDVILLNKLNELYNDFCYYRDIVVNGNLKWVLSIAKKYQSNHEKYFDDIIQSGNMGLIRAVEKYNPFAGSSFSNYAKRWIEQNIIRSIKKMTHSVGVPEYLLYNTYHLLNAKNELCIKFNREVSNEELSIYTGISVEDIELLFNALFYTISLDESLGTECDDMTCINLVDTIVDEKGSVFDEVLKDVSLINIENVLYPYLNEKEIEVIKFYYGFAGKDYTVRQIAVILNLSKQRISAIKNKAIKKLQMHPEIKTLF